MSQNIDNVSSLSPIRKILESYIKLCFISKRCSYNELFATPVFFSLLMYGNDKRSKERNDGYNDDLTH